jgi:nucleoside-diphosphate-sugar epimerase
MTQDTPTVMLCGCGWLGQPLGLKLTQVPINVYGTTTRSEQLPILQKQGIDPIEFVLDKTDVANTVYPASLLTAFTHTDVLVVNIPPGRRHLHAPPFIDGIKQLIQQAINGNSNINIVFVSTTSVFGDITGNVDGDTPVTPVTASGKAHAAIEQWCLHEFPKHACVVRLAGLIDDQRHPVTALVKRPSLANGEQRVNLVHKDDVISALVQILTTDFQHVAGRTLHLCAPDHPTRQDYYQAAADAKGLGHLSFSSDKAQDKHEFTAEGKIVLAQKTQQLLGFEYQYPSPYDML